MTSRGGTLGAGSYPFFGCVVLLAAMILHILTFASPFWAEDDEGEFGLWRVHGDYCEGKFEESDACKRWNDLWESSDWLQAVRGLECLTIIFWAVPLVVLPVYIYVALGLYYRCLMGTFTCFTLLGALCNIVGVTIFRIKIAEESELTLRWCLSVCAIGGVFGICAFIIFLVSTLNKPKFQHQQHFLSGFYVDPDRNRMYVVENVDPAVHVAPPNGSTIVGPAQVNPTLASDYN